ncbi:MAG: phage integrase SAM-like domain-containing protein [Saprospiraceae bacterium]|nr:phage integrase SAM-like domain-containing protein [Candidatus Defluviibacterium haderslevense]
MSNIAQIVNGYIDNCNLSQNPIDKLYLDKLLDDRIFKSNQTLDNKPKKTSKKTNLDKLNLSLIRDFSKVFIQDITSRRRQIGAGEQATKYYSQSTIKGYHTFFNNFLAFELGQGVHYHWDQMDHNLYAQFVEFCNLQDFSPNYTGKMIKIWKVIAGAAYVDGIHSNLYYKDKRFKIIREKVPKIYLTESEVT